MSLLQKLNDAARKFMATKDPADYKKWSDEYDALNPEELEQVGGGTHYPGFEQ
jgi:hypothetical protein